MASGGQASVSLPDGVWVGADVGEVRRGGPPAKHIYDVIRDSLACGGCADAECMA